VKVFPGSASILLAFFCFLASKRSKPFVHITSALCTILVQIEALKPHRMSSSVTL
jgi:hypothetical protein